MKLLLVNTCGGVGVVALAAGGVVLAEEALPGRGTSEALMPAVRRLFAYTDFAFAELGGVVVVIGPGSFTGVRVGLAAAKGLCEAAGCGMIALSRLQLIAAAAPGDDALAVLDGGRGEFYAGGADVQEALVSAMQLARLGLGRVLVTCEDRVLVDGVVRVPEPGAAGMLAMALQRIDAGAWSDVAMTDANYLRRTDAELKLR